jgi:hypothetical protein
MLVTQIGVAHVGAMTAMGRMADATNDQARESYSRIAARMSQGFLSQLDAPRRHRARSSPALGVGHVAVNEGGQAIVGTVHASARAACTARRLPVFLCICATLVRRMECVP